MAEHEEDISQTTRCEFYSGPASNVSAMMRQIQEENTQVVENVTISDVTTQSINEFQEKVDRELDDKLRGIYAVPIHAYNVGKIRVPVFPGLLREIAILLTATRVLMSQFYDVNPQQSDSINQYREQAELKLKQLLMNVDRLPGNRKRARHRTLPAAMEPQRDPVEM